MKRNIHIIIFIMLLVPVFPKWFEKEKIVKKTIQAKYDRNKTNMFVLVNLKSNKHYLASIFCRVDKKIETINDLFESTFLFTTNLRKFIYSFTPEKNGDYYFALTFLNIKEKEYDRYAFVPYNAPVRVTNAIEVPAIEDIITSDEDALADGLEGLTEDIDAITNITMDEESGEHVDITGPPDHDLITALLHTIRKINLSVKTKYSRKNKFSTLEVNQFFVEYTEASAEIDKAYKQIITNRANWPFLIGINKEFSFLTQTFRDISKKIYRHLEEKKGR
ncbi:hypothetical protein ACFL6D_03155 [Spirochaetota bacterium]